jgi:periplasmic copper chaperone A
LCDHAFFLILHKDIAMQFQTLAVAVTVAFGLSTMALQAHAHAHAHDHDGVAIVDPYLRTTGGAGSNAAAFMVLENHVNRDDRLIAAASDVAEHVALHTHILSAEGLMQMLPVEDGFAIPPLGQHALARGGDHIMLMGLTRDLADGDMVTLTLTFAASGEVVVEVPVDNARTGATEGHGTMGHGAAHADTRPPLPGAALRVKGAYALVTSANAPNAAVFLDVVNMAASEDRLIAVQTEIAERAELHTHAMTEEGLMQMLPVEGGIAIPAGGTHPLARGGDHVMLMGLTRPVPQGGQFALTLTFEKAGKVVVIVPVQSAGAAVHGDGHSGHGAAATVKE